MVNSENEVFKKLCEIVQKNPDDYQKRTGNDQEYDRFIKNFPSKNITNLTLDEYCIGTGRQDNFCWWIEFGLTNVLGGYSARGASGHFIYKRKEDGSIQKHRIFDSLPDDKVLIDVLSIHSVIANAVIDDIDWIDNDNSLCEKANVNKTVEFGEGRKLRILSIYHPDEVIPISNGNHLEHFLIQFGLNPEKIPLRNKPIARMKLLLEYYYKAIKQNKNLTPYGFMSVLYSNELNISPVIPRSRNTEEPNAVDVKEKKKSLPDIKLPLNQILYGPPGTGKTYNTVNLALETIGLPVKEDDDRKSVTARFKKSLGKDKQIVFTTFHQSYSYEDFVEGIKVEKVEGTKELSYNVKSGVFKALCEEAAKNTDKPYVIIIDEINRGNISKIFGELITLIEPDKRTGEDEGITVTLPYSKEPFSVPSNVYIIGTMNTADASLAKIDIALRRRFDFVNMPAEPKLLTDTKVDGVNLSSMLTEMNKRIEVLYDRDHTIGHSFFMKLSNKSKLIDLEKVFRKNIIPLLQEYFFEDWERIHWVLDCLKDENNTEIHFVKKKYTAGDLKGVMGSKWSENNKKNYDGVVWELNEDAFDSLESYRAIYLEDKQASK